MATDVQFAVSRIASINPATGEVLGELDSAGPAEVRAAVARARAAQPDWVAWGVRNRISVVRRFQQLILRRKTDVARRITQESGKPQVEALITEVLVVLDAARFLIEHGFALLRDEPLAHGNLAHTPGTVRRYRNHFAVELSVFDSGDRSAGRARCGKRRRPQALGTGAVDCAGTPKTDARGWRSERSFPGVARGWGDRRRSDAKRY
jgi:hypothetical protein